MLQKQAVEISRATAAFTVTLPARQPAAGRGGRGGRGGGANAEAGEDTPAPPAPLKPLPPVTREFPAGSYIVRMDQPYSRIADALLDYQVLGAERRAVAPVRRHRLDVPGGLRACRRCASPT